MDKEKITFGDWNLADQIEAVIELAIQKNDSEYLLKAIGDIARSKGIAKIVRELNLDRASLYKSLSPAGNPYFFTVLKVLDNLRLCLKVEQKEPA
ncbi:MAG: putative addiction module antidote protein [Treponema sp.]|jgi:probable addiction module antidote protein|nr:putative addiction module antidote protein [Treponema sp.]